VPAIIEKDTLQYVVVIWGSRALALPQKKTKLLVDNFIPLFLLHTMISRSSYFALLETDRLYVFHSDQDVIGLLRE
jgi:hypothetical protein